MLRAERSQLHAGKVYFCHLRDEFNAYLQLKPGNMTPKGPQKLSVLTACPY